MTIISNSTALDRHATEAGDEAFVMRSYGKKRSEKEFSRWVVKEFSGFVSRVEPGLGGDVGNPDLLLLSEGLPCLLPIEAKLGRIKGNRLYPSEVRPAQVSWWHRYIVSGGVGALLIDCGSDGIWIVDGTYMNQWQDGYAITGGEADGAYQLNPERFTESLESFIENQLME